MASVTISRQFPDGDLISVHIHVKESFPDVVREAVRGALDAYAEAFANTLATAEDDE